MPSSRSVIAPIVGALGLAVCAGPALAGGVSPDEIGGARVRDVVRWTNEHWAWIIAALAVVSGLIIYRYRVIRPGGLDGGGRDLKPIPAIMWLFAALATFFALAVGGEIARLVPVLEDAPIRGQALKMTLSFGVAAVFGVGLLWFVAKQAGSAGVKPGWVDIPMGIGLFLLVYPVVALSGLVALWVARGIGTVPPDRLAHETLGLIGQHKGDPWIWLLVFVLVLVVPLVEELIYRVYLQSALARAIPSRWAAVVLTSGLFVAPHYSVVPENARFALAQIFVLSLALGAAYERTGRLGVPIAMHASFNVLNLMLAFLIDPMV